MSVALEFCKKASLTQFFSPFSHKAFVYSPSTLSLIILYLEQSCNLLALSQFPIPYTFEVILNPIIIWRYSVQIIMAILKKIWSLSPQNDLSFYSLSVIIYLLIIDYYLFIYSHMDKSKLPSSAR